MIRTLLLITGAGFVLAAVCFVAAAALGGYNIAERHWGWRHAHDWPVGWDDGAVPGVRGDGASGTREIPWTGGDSLEVDVPADIQFTQGPGPGKLVVSGPRDAVDHLVLDGSRLESEDGGWWDGPVSVTMTAPGVRRFQLAGSGALAIDNYAQDSLDIDVSGSGRVSAKGKTQSLRLDISGSGDADLAGLQAGRAEAEISGSGRARVAPTEAADLHISGDGEIDLVTHPASVNSDVTGSGRIIEDAKAG
jgi:hypothetical protein